MWRVNFATLFILMVPTLSYAQALSDPTAPPRVIERSQAGESSTKRLNLQSIQWKGTERSALINGEWLYPGDKLNSYTIQTIEMSQVTLRDQRTNQLVTLRLFGFTKQRDSQAARSGL
ncbi:hypothetical protein [Pseudidiomarina sp.]|uniref:hypothetical protein n=1 Tax=Pseudidiomarina sp. TaxID=2081707 RepID=UPI003A979951